MIGLCSSIASVIGRGGKFMGEALFWEPFSVFAGSNLQSSVSRTMTQTQKYMVCFAGK
tara:strand:+ start:92 stop:265 length:174 start_codon:yes stop_codon:yes gene_type:complete